MNEPQVWTLIGVFTTIMLGGMTLMTAMINRTMTHAIGGLRGELTGEITGLRGELTGEISGLRGELTGEISALRTEMSSRFDAMDTRIDHLDRDVTFLMRRAWGEPEPD